ncbi:PLP-dependent aminotransferase family protein [Clostridium sp. 'deep sea']|uniref:aminotransferase-like domain-containing protein n=1 Tax=Clostridium sp. 'deep sea' TaxID=2779445 RepID=UPI00189649FC|nr:PLP-dependent aminotransferase family protein [Clostridium sp. 'deep sea']QOR36678.1 PLP-dependent aminotransferase family protein [Clostridium sp. 'deep sea']
MKYEQIVRDIKNLILNSKLNAGDKLPSIRHMATKYTCNKDTVIRAYKELELNHYLYSIPKSGYYVVDSLTKNNKSNSQLIDFKTTLPDSRLLPYKEFNHSITKAIAVYKQELFTYGEVKGLMQLREIVQNLLWQNNIYSKTENIFITSGVQQALNILMNMPINNKYNILVEQPTYNLMQRIAELGKGQVYGIKRDKQGIDMAELKYHFANNNIKFFYTIPRFHNPLGSSYTDKQKQQIVELANIYNVYIVEDDYLGDLATSNNNLTLFNYDTGEKVIYLKSFSKSFMPGLRIGAIILPTKLQTSFTKYKKYDDINTSILAQGGLAIFIKSGMFNNHLLKIRSEYKSKMNYANACLKTNLVPGLDFIKAETGFFVWLTLPKKINVNKLELRLLNKNILISSAKNFYAKQKSVQNSLRLCISALSKQQIKQGVFTILNEIKYMNK